MATIGDGDARRRIRFLRLYAEGLLSANELFLGLLDTFSEVGIPEELERAGAEVREQVRAFLAEFRPVTFRPFVMGQPLTADEAMRWEQQRRRIHAGLFLALAIDDPSGQVSEKPAPRPAL